MNLSVEKRFLTLLLALMMIFSLLPWWTVEVKAASLDLGINGLGIEWNRVKGSSGSANSDSDKKNLTIYAQAVRDGCATAQTEVEVTLTNNSGATAILSFSYSKTSGSGSVSFDPNGGNGNSYSAQLAPGETVTIKVNSAGDGGDKTEYSIANISLTSPNASFDVTINYDSTLGSVTADGTGVSDGDTIPDVTLEEGVALVASPNSEVSFLGWIDTHTGVVLSTATTYTLKPGGDTSVKAAFMSNDGSSVAWFGVGAAKYDNLQTACDAAASGSTKTVVLLDNGTLQPNVKDGNVVPYVIPAGVTLLIPRNGDYKLYGVEPEFLSQVSNASNVPDPYAWRTLMLAEGAKINVEGTIEVAGKFKTMQGGFPKSGMICDAYGAIYMSQGSNITLSKAGATLYAWGYIYGNGSVVATNGTKVYEIIQVPDYLGGTNLSGFVGNNAKKSFPFSQYYIQNIEVPLTINYGATEFVYTAMTVDAKIMVVDIGTPIEFIGANGMFVPEVNSTIVKTYDPTTDRLIFDINGDAQLKNLVLDMSDHEYAWALQLIIKSTVIDSADYILSLNGNITVNVNSGTMTIGQNVTLLPGVKIYVAQGATVDLSSDPNAGRLNASGTGGYNLYVFNKAQWGAYIFQNQTILAAQYSPSSGRKVRTAADLTDVEIDINGTIICNGFVYTTTDGTTNTSAVISSEGTGKIIFNNGAGDATTFYHLNGANTEISTTKVVSAVLKNADGSYVETSGAVKGTTYQYCSVHGVWWNTGHTCCNGHDYTGKAKNNEDGTHSYLCTKGCGTYGNPAQHSYESVVTLPTCTEQGFTTHTCTVCGDNYKDT